MTDSPIKWGDAQQYAAEPHANYAGEGLGVMPSVTLLWMTPDPLGAVAAMSAMYSGNVIRSLNDVTDDMRRKAFDDVQKTHLKAPLEAVKLHFLVEGVDRSFTHQHVRQRTAVYAQESMRFAVLGQLAEATTLPPSLQGTERRAGQPPVPGERTQAQQWRDTWDNAINTIDAAYHMLVDTGMPAEEARGLLPHATATRLHYITDLRNLSDHAGNRLCTQAQFHWRIVFAQIVQAIADYPRRDCYGEGDVCYLHDEAVNCQGHGPFQEQYGMIASSGLFRPVCYQLGYCPFEASFDRACSIRDRVHNFSRQGVPSSEWGPGSTKGNAIRNEEWLLNPAAARSKT